MLRITLKREQTGKTVFYLEGKISRDYVTELHNAICGERLKKSKIILDFKKVSYLDEQAVEMIKTFPSEEIQVKNCSLFICAMLDLKSKGE